MALSKFLFFKQMFVELQDVSKKVCSVRQDGEARYVLSRY